jgi:hypothetical protein
VGFVVLVVVLAVGIAYWYVSIPVLVLTAIAVGVTVHRQHVHRASAAAAQAGGPAVPAVAVASAPQAPRLLRPPTGPPLTMPADTFKIGSLVHLEKDGTRATYFVDHGRTPDEIVLKRVTSTPISTDA